MSGQIEQRRLARPAYQLDVLDGFVWTGAGRAATPGRGAAWRALTVARRHHEETADRRRCRSSACRSTEGPRRSEPRDLQAGEEDMLRADRERMRHAAELAEGAARGDGGRRARRRGGGGVPRRRGRARTRAADVRLAPELEGPASELRELTVRLSEVGSDLHRFVATLEADPERQEQVEARLDLIAELRRRFGAQTLEELLERRGERRRRSRRPRRWPRPARGRRGRARTGRGGGLGRRSPRLCTWHERERRSRLPSRWRRTSRGSAWARASFGSS